MSDTPMRDEKLGLPLKLMIADAKQYWPSDMACHVYALVAEVEKLSAACAVAMNHLDTYGTATGGHDAEMASQSAAFDALRPFTKVCGHKFVSLYAETSSS